jgi:hypothetical protein
MEEKMHKQIISQWVLVILQIFIGASAIAGNETHGGDPLRFLFEDARQSAASRVLAAEECGFGSNVPSDVRQWIMAHKQMLAEDILASQHVWVTDNQDSCASTQTTSKADITLSYNTCRSTIQDISQAIRLLIHESTHHFGVSQELLPDEVAEAIYNLGVHSQCSVPPSQDPFDPGSCPGAHISSSELMGFIPLPNATEKTIGRYSVAERMRVCYGENFCTAWQPADNKGLYFTLSDTVAAKSGLVIAEFVQNSPRIRFLSNYAEKPFYLVISKIVNEQASVIAAGNGDYQLKVGMTNIAGNMTGWMTNSCLRQSIKANYDAKDANSNDITKEYETVFLSHF